MMVSSTSCDFVYPRSCFLLLLLLEPVVFLMTFLAYMTFLIIIFVVCWKYVCNAQLASSFCVTLRLTVSFVFDLRPDPDYGL